jgi:hypothetical protein
MKRSKSKTPEVGNLPLAQAMIGKRTSNAAGKHADKRDKRARTRSASKQRSMKEYE